MNAGDKVTPKTKAGLQVTSEPTDGTYKQKRTVVGVFRGVGTIREITSCFIDYDDWSRQSGDEGESVGVVEYFCCLVEYEGGLGWCGLGALNPV